MGAERRSMIISDKEKRTTAVHEAGHALVAKVLPGADPVHKVTIIPRGRALGLTQQLPEEDRLNINQEFALNQIAILMGGRVAEELIFGAEDHRRRQRHRAGHRPGPRHGLRVGHEREHGAARLRQEGGGGLPGARDGVHARPTPSRPPARSTPRCGASSPSSTSGRRRSCSSAARGSTRSPTRCSSTRPSTSPTSTCCSPGGAITRPPPPKSQPPSATATGDKEKAKKGGILGGLGGLPKAEPGKA